MSNFDIIRAWKDEKYRNSLTDEQRSQLPANPAGMIELSDQEMAALAGGKAKITGSGTGNGNCACDCSKGSTGTGTTAGSCSCNCSAFTCSAPVISDQMS